MLRYPSSFSQHSLAQNIDRARHSQFMKEALPHLIGGLLTAGLIYWIYQDYAVPYGDVIWLITNLVLLGSTVIFYSIYYLKREFFNQQQWSNVVIVIAAIWGAAWSLPPYLFLNTNQAEYIALMLIIISMLATTPAPAMVHYISAYYAFMSLPMFALFFKLLSSDLNVLLTLFMPFLWLTQLAYGWQLHGTMINSIRLRLENAQSRKEAENASQAKSKFLAAASHDIRQPLQAVNLFLVALKDKLNGKEDDKLFHQLESSVDNMSELLNSLLDVSKLDAQSIEPRAKHINLQALLVNNSQEFRSLAKNKGLEFYCNLDAAVAFADPILLSRVINNLLSNAIRYTNEGHVSLSCHLQDDHIKVTVSDTGKGISSDEQKEIFTEFYQVDNPERDQQKGLGLGLAIVKRLCTLQNWPVKLNSTLMKGSTFSIQVPVGIAQEVLIEQATTIIGSQGLSGKKILVIDDDHKVRAGLTSLLQGWQCEVKEYESIAQIQQDKQLLDWPVDLILSDFRLRNNESGIDAIALLKELYQRDITSVLITGDTDPVRVQQAKESGLTVLHKPVKPAQLRVVLQKKLKAAGN